MNRNLSRRDFLKLIVAASSGPMLLSGCTLPAAMPDGTLDAVSVEAEYDVLIVGAGIAGLTAAYYLRQQPIVVLESAPYAGGRTLSGDYHGYAYAKGGEKIEPNNRERTALPEAKDVLFERPCMPCNSGYSNFFIEMRQMMRSFSFHFSRVAVLILILILIVGLTNCNVPATPTSGNLPIAQPETTPTTQLKTTPVTIDPTLMANSSTATIAPTNDAGESQDLLFSAPDGRWRIRYPGERLGQESLGDDLTIFISADRGTFAAVDSFVAEGDVYGNTGEGLRNRARDTLERIYGRPVIEEDIIAFPPEPWATGISFTTERGSKGAALYRQPGRRQGNYQVYGFLYGYKAVNEADALPLLQAIQVALEME